MRRIMPALILTLLVIAQFALPATIDARERDPLASVIDMDQPQLLTTPPDLFTGDQQEAIVSMVNEARLFGVPLTVRAISVPSSLDILSEAQPIEGAAATGQEMVQRLGEEWLIAEEQELIKDDITPKISSDEGILLLVVVPEDDHTRSIAAFAVGDKALPLNGLTHDKLDQVLENVIYPFFRADTISGGIQSGIAYLSYDNLFGVPARIERSDNQEKLATITNTVMSGATALSVAALAGLLAWIHRRRRNGDEPDTEVSPFEAAALARGRVDDDVMTGALLHLVQRGALVPHADRRWSIDRDVEVGDACAGFVLARLASEADDEGTLPDHVLRRQEDVLAPAQRAMEDDLANRGLITPDARIETVWVLIACGIVAAIAVFLLSPGMASLSRFAVFLAGFAFLAVAGAIVWIATRPWTTTRGEATLQQWTSTDHSTEEAAIFDLITNQDALVRSPGGPELPSPIRMVRELRALGAG